MHALRHTLAPHGRGSSPTLAWHARRGVLALLGTRARQPCEPFLVVVPLLRFSSLARTLFRSAERGTGSCIFDGCGIACALVQCCLDGEERAGFWTRPHAITRSSFSFLLRDCTLPTSTYIRSYLYSSQWVVHRHIPASGLTYVDCASAAASSAASSCT